MLRNASRNEVGLNEGAKISSVSLIPVVLEDGLPRVDVAESNRFGSRWIHKERRSATGRIRCGELGQPSN
jgi:hypothetical protein